MVKLLKQISTYKDKDGNDKTATNFSLQCGDTRIPIEVKYFENKETGRDPAFAGRKMVLSSYAEEVTADAKA
jgi:hypothetical protein